MQNAKSINNFIEIINCLIGYYSIKIETDQYDSSEEWKVKAGMIQKKEIPKEIDMLVNQAFVVQLKKYVK